MVVLTAGFARVFPEKWLELNSLKRQTKAEEEGRDPELGQNGGTEDCAARVHPGWSAVPEYHHTIF
jgi:hypothetical protein